MLFWLTVLQATTLCVYWVLLDPLLEQPEPSTVELPALQTPTIAYFGQSFNCPSIFSFTSSLLNKSTSQDVRLAMLKGTLR